MFVPLCQVELQIDAVKAQYIELSSTWCIVTKLIVNIFPVVTTTVWILRHSIGEEAMILPGYHTSDSAVSKQCSHKFLPLDLASVALG